MNSQPKQWAMCLLVVCSLSSTAQRLDEDLQRKIAEVIRLADQIKPGMTRSQLIKSFATEGGLSSRTWNHYVLRSCPTIKLDITFDIPKGAELAPELPTDVIKTVSKPYLQYSIYD